MERIEKIIELLERDKVFETEGAAPAATAEALHSLWPEAYPASLSASRGRVYVMAREAGAKFLFIIVPRGNMRELNANTGFEPMKSETLPVNGRDFLFATCSMSHENAVALGREFPFTRPRPCALATSFGMGDRIGIATPGHLRAAKTYNVFPVLAQQSIREMDRTGRSPDQIMDDASWAVFQEGFRRGFGSDADHLKTEDAIRITAAAGFTMFTVDPGDHIVDAADTWPKEKLEAELLAMFGGSTAERDTFMKRYSGDFNLSDPVTGASHTFTLEPDNLLRIAVKYLPAVRHTIKLYNLLKEIKGSEPFDFEMSVDETATPTTPEAHLFVSCVLRAANVLVHGLAPRFVGQFQKGIDYIGDIGEFRELLELHALLARALGPYKLSIHSGSDKFSIFPIVSELTHGLFHEKTAGTSYLEAIRVVMRRDPALYREIHRFALGRFQEDRASYHVTTNLAAIPPLDSLKDSELPALMDEIDSRQLIHITYGSVLTAKKPDGSPLFRDRIVALLNSNEEEHYDTVASHFVHHCESLGLKKVVKA